MGIPPVADDRRYTSVTVKSPETNCRWAYDNSAVELPHLVQTRKKINKRCAVMPIPTLLLEIEKPERERVNTEMIYLIPSMDPTHQLHCGMVETRDNLQSHQTPRRRRRCKANWCVTTTQLHLILQSMQPNPGTAYQEFHLGAFLKLSTTSYTPHTGSSYKLVLGFVRLVRRQLCHVSNFVTRGGNVRGH
jgi:hypothetical protein